MNAELTIMTIQFGVLLVAILSLTFQQRRALRNAEKVDRRTEMKLKLFYLIQDKEMLLDDIVLKAREILPFSDKVDEVEIRKSLYEMLKD